MSSGDGASPGNIHRSLEGLAQHKFYAHLTQPTSICLDGHRIVPVEMIHYGRYMASAELNIIVHMSAPTLTVPGHWMMRI